MNTRLRTSAVRRVVRLVATGLAAAGLAAVAFGPTGCAQTGGDRAGPAPITGRLRADRIPPDATIEVYRDEGGPAVPLPGVTARLDALGEFTTPYVVPGRYIVVLRTREQPPSTTSVVVPDRPEADLRPASPGAGATITVLSPPTAPRERTCRLCPAEARSGVPDRREVVIQPGQEVRLAGLAPGLWHVDVFPDGATADFIVPSDDRVARLLIDPPESPATGPTLQGTVLRTTGGPAFGASVTVRSVTLDGSFVQPWGRVAAVGPTGAYRVDRLSTGLAYVRVESRDAAFLAPPSPELISISPSVPNTREWLVQP